MKRYINCIISVITVILLLIGCAEKVEMETLIYNVGEHIVRLSLPVSSDYHVSDDGGGIRVFYGTAEVLTGKFIDEEAYNYYNEVAERYGYEDLSGGKVFRYEGINGEENDYLIGYEQLGVYLLITDPTIEGTYLREFLSQLQIEVPDLEVSTESEIEQ